MKFPLRIILLLTLGAAMTLHPFGAKASSSLLRMNLVDGCMDEIACNFDPTATTDDGSCDYFSCLIGCMDSMACNFNAAALYPNNGTCEYQSCFGCMDISACNFDDTATILNENACDYTCFGCSDFTACNFDSNATLPNLAACFYATPDFDCEGNPTGCGGCEPLFIADFTDEAVECSEQLPLTSLDTVVAVGSCTGDTLPHAMFAADMRDDVVINAGFTGVGTGTDGAIRILGLTSLGLSESDYFIETVPLILTRFSNGVATLTGEVANAVNPLLTWSVHLTFEDAQTASTWLDADPSHGLVAANGCSMDPDNVLVYRLKADQSFLIGKDSYLNSYLKLSHMPFNENKRFQLGQGANSSNCAYGFGGWFAWEGQVLDTPVVGMTGDVVIDLSSDGVNVVPCGLESTTLFYSVLNPDCGQLTEAAQVFNRLDMSAPVWTGDCAVEITLCANESDVSPSIPSPCEMAFEDACNEPLLFSFTETLVTGDTLDGGAFVLERTYSAEDCSGNTGVFMQTIAFAGETCPEQIDLVAQETHGFFNHNALGSNVSSMGADWMIESAPSSAPFVHPNPSKGTAWLNWTSQRSGQTTLEVFHADGSMALSPILLQVTSNEHQRVQLLGTTLPAGIYFVRILSSAGKQVVPWVVID